MATRTTTPRASGLYLREKPWSEAEFREWIRRDGLSLAPATLTLCLVDSSAGGEGDTHDMEGDGLFVATWGERQERFVAEYKSSSTPKVVEAAIAQARLWAEKTGFRPLVVTPYLSEDTLHQMQEKGVSGVDLCGNGVLLAADFSVWRTGAPNRFKNSQPIRNVYRGTSSLFARALLLRPTFDSLLSLQSFARERLTVTGGQEQLAKGTASKVVQALEEELIVRREGRGVRLTDPTRLLERLRENYRKPQGQRVLGKTELDPAALWQRLRVAAEEGKGDSAFRAVVTGDGSAGRYGLLSGLDRLSLYVSDLEGAARLLEVRPTRVFPNVELFEMTDETAYFDRRERADGWWASPIQVWLELVTGGPRERDAAESLYTALRDAKTEEMP